MGRGKVKLQIQEWPKVRVLVVLCPLSAPRSWGGEQCCLVLGKSLPSGSADPSVKQALAVVGSSSQQIAKYLGWCFHFRSLCSAARWEILCDCAVLDLLGHCHGGGGGGGVARIFCDEGS